MRTLSETWKEQKKTKKWESEDKKLVLLFIKNSMPQKKGIPIVCPVCKKQVINEHSMVSPNNTWQFPSGLDHLVTHGIKPDQEFIDDAVLWSISYLKFFKR